MTLVQMELNIAKLKQQQQEQELKTAQNKIRFLTNVSQQLFTPLTLIYAPVNELLRRTRDSRDPVPTHDAYCLSEIERNSLRLIRLIEQQLDYEKLDRWSCRSIPTNWRR